MILGDIGKLIKEYNNFAIVCHSSPDGDSLGSMLGLYIALLQEGKIVDFFVEDSIPMRYRFLPRSSSFQTMESAKESYECLFVLDCGDLERLGKCKELAKRARIVVNIDHHLTNDLFGQLNFVDTNASSVGEIIYQLLKINGMEVSYETAICLYTSIIADTGGFKYSNTSSLTLSIAGDLMNTGIDFSTINNLVFDVKSVSQIRLLSKVSATLETWLNGQLATLFLTRQMLDECNALEEDASEFVNFARDIEGVEVGVFIKEKDEQNTRISLRSKGIVDVRAIAENFGGGGHLRAAGCSVSGNVQQALQQIVAAIDKAMEVN